MVLSKEHPREIRYRSPEPILTPTLAAERSGTVDNVVFPTGIDRRDDLGLPNRFNAYYGMADDCIGVARFGLAACLAVRTRLELLRLCTPQARLHTVIRCENLRAKASSSPSLG